MKRIVSIEQLYQAAKAKQSVICPKSQGLIAPRPAAFVLNFQGKQLRHLFVQGLYIYKKDEGNIWDEKYRKKIGYDCNMGEQNEKDADRRQTPEIPLS